MSINYGSIKVKELLIKIKNGALMVPSFQRDFEWSSKDIARLYTSVVLKDEPFGSIVVWDDSGISKAIPNESKIFSQIANNTSDTQRSYLIDGQQRVTSFALSFLWNSKANANHLTKIKSVFYDLNSGKFLSTKVPNNEMFPCFYFQTDNFIARVQDYFKNWNKELSPQELLQIQNAYMKFQDVDAGVVTIFSDNLNDVIEIFTLINTKGKKLSPFNLVHAYYIKSNKKFNLTEKYSKIVSNRHSLKGRWDIPMSTMLLLHYSIARNTISNKEILDYAENSNYILDEVEFIENKFQKIFDQTIDELENLGYYGFDFLPSDKFLYLVAKVVHEIDGKNLTSSHKKIINQWFKLAVLNDRYASGAEGSKINGFKEDWEVLKNFIIKDKIIVDEIKWAKIKMFERENILQISYQSTSFEGKYVVSRIIKNIPSLASGALVKPTSNKMKNLNLHHIFPVGNAAYEDDELVTSIANITPLEASDNIDISNNSPSQYLKKYIKTDDEYEKLLFPKNLLEDPNEFISERAELIAKKINFDWD